MERDIPRLETVPLPDRWVAVYITGMTADYDTHPRVYASVIEADTYPARQGGVAVSPNVAQRVDYTNRVLVRESHVDWDMETFREEVLRVEPRRYRLR